MIFSRSAMEFEDFILIVACFLGFISLCKTVTRFLKWVWVSFFRPAKNLNEYGSWALVTGSTDGIGKALAFELASKGINLVLVGRNPSKLEATSNEIRERFARKVDVKDIVIDLAKFSGEEISNMVEEGIKGLDVGILINNAGMGPPYPMFIHEVESEVLESFMRVNMDAATWVTRAVLPGMLQKKKGAIVNIGSGSSMAVPAFPLCTLYASSKAYLAMFSRCISLEYEEHGIDVQCQVPLFVATKMIRGFNTASLFTPSPEMYSKASIRCIGYEHICTPYWLHSVQWFLIQRLPDALLNWYLFKLFLKMRKRRMEKYKVSSVIH
ncbi:very-long-chain 3-oxoacyl-CoA reductase 1-like [Juglans microcarpa x Juglans regia]|uniref:very-long-chain 3-oxoacyl-CoA reductase 1-like n=1 Tax=Juglans microcarpa x Juglans regia TaxID=2249226 RepID=UPI001B7E61F3|nr:very-long-chain 3-oxoacyl-CoA reductase 1-like [Juglans microcarpa x Juglans regia]